MPNYYTEKKSYKDIGATCSDLEGIVNEGLSNAAESIIDKLKAEITLPFRDALCAKIEELEAVEEERDNLRERVEQLESELDDVKDRLKTSEDENYSLEARIEELENGE